VAHIQHIAGLVGIEHVAIGSDFEGGITPPTGLKTARSYPKLAEALLEHGFDEQQVRQVFSVNALGLLGCPSQ
jgi:membrane dipeptidase